MNYLKFTPFLYLAVSGFFIYDGIVQLSNPEGTYWLSFGIAAVCIFMFFFRRHFAKKMMDRNQNRS